MKSFINNINKNFAKVTILLLLVFCVMGAGTFCLKQTVVTTEIQNEVIAEESQTESSDFSLSETTQTSESEETASSNVVSMWCEMELPEPTTTSSTSDYVTSSTLTAPSGITTTYIIDTPQKLAWIAANNESKGGFANTSFILTADLNMSGRLWTPIGYPTSFKGYFNGNGHTITGLTMDSSQSYNNNHSFIYYLSGEVYDLIVKQTSGLNCVVGQSSYDDQGLVKNCYSDINLAGSISDNSPYGGLIVKHNISGASSKQNVQQYYNSTPIGVNNLYYEVVVNGKTTKQGMTKDDEILESPNAFTDICENNNKTISGVTVAFFNPFTLVWENEGSVTISTSAQYSKSNLQLNFTRGASERNFNGSAASGLVTVNVGFAHQCAVRINVTTEGKYNNLSLRIYEIDTTKETSLSIYQCAYNAATDVLTGSKDEGGKLIDWQTSTQFSVNIVCEEEGVNAERFNGGSVPLRYGDKVTIKIGKYVNKINGFITWPDVGMKDSNANDMAQRRYSSAEGVLFEYLGGNISIYLKNAFEVTVSNGSISLGDDGILTTGDSATGAVITNADGSVKFVTNANSGTHHVTPYFSVDREKPVTPISLEEYDLIDSSKQPIKLTEVSGYNYCYCVESSTSIDVKQYYIDNGVHIVWVLNDLSMTFTRESDKNIDDGTETIQYEIFNPYSKISKTTTSLGNSATITVPYTHQVRWYMGDNDASSAIKFLKLTAADSTYEDKYITYKLGSVDGANNDNITSRDGALSIGETTYDRAIVICAFQGSQNPPKYTIGAYSIPITLKIKVIKDDSTVTDLSYLNDIIFNYDDGDKSLKLNDLTADSEGYVTVLTNYSPKITNDDYCFSFDTKYFIQKIENNSAEIIGIIHALNNKKFNFSEIKEGFTLNSEIKLTLNIDTSKTFSVQANYIDNDDSGNKIVYDGNGKLIEDGTTLQSIVVNLDDDNENNDNINVLFSIKYATFNSIKVYNYYYNENELIKTDLNENDVEISLNESEPIYSITISNCSDYYGLIGIDLIYDKINYTLDITETSGYCDISNATLTFTYLDTIRVTTIKDACDFEILTNNTVASTATFTANVGYEIDGFEFEDERQTASEYEFDNLMKYIEDDSKINAEVLTKASFINATIRYLYYYNDEYTKFDSYTEEYMGGSLVAPTLEFYNFSEYRIQTGENEYKNSADIDIESLDTLEEVREYLYDGEFILEYIYIPYEYEVELVGHLSIVYTVIYPESNTIIGDCINSYHEELGAITGFEVVGLTVRQSEEYKLNDYNFTTGDSFEDVLEELNETGKNSNQSITLDIHYAPQDVKFNFKAEHLDGSNLEYVVDIDDTYNYSIHWNENTDSIHKTFTIKNLDGIDISYTIQKWAIGDTIIAYKTTSDNVLEGYEFIADETQEGDIQTGYAYLTEWNGYTTDNNGDAVLEYKVIGTVTKNVIEVTFEGTYLENQEDDIREIQYGTLNYGEIPTPSRRGYNFVYWMAKTINPEEKVVNLKIEKIEGVWNLPICETLEANITFYAYWEVDDSITSSEDYVRDYNGEYQTDLIIAMLPYISDMNIDKDHILVYKGTEQISSNLISQESYDLIIDENKNEVQVQMSRIKYVSDSGSYSIKFIYTYKDADDASGKNYIINTDVVSLSSNWTRVIVNPVELYYNDSITKTFDRTSKVNQNIYGFYGDDSNIISIARAYSSVYVGNDITVSHEVVCNAENCSDEQCLHHIVAECYILPTVTGEITPFVINLNKISAVIPYNGIDDLQIVLQQGIISAEGNIATYSVLTDTGIINNLSEVQDLLNEDSAYGLNKQTISYSIYITESSIGAYGSVDLVVDYDIYEDDSKIEKQKASVIFESSEAEVEIIDLEENQKNFNFYAVKENIGASNIAENIAKISNASEEYVSVSISDNYAYNIFIEECIENPTFKVQVEILDGCFWLDKIVIAAADGITELASVDKELTTSGAIEFEVSITEEKIYYVYFVFTEKSIVTLDYRLAEEENLVSGEVESPIQITYGTTIDVGTTFGMPERVGLIFTGWYYVDEEGNNVSVANGPWEYKRNLTLYAGWVLDTESITIIRSSTNTELAEFSNELNVVYNPKYTYSIEVVTENEYLTYTYEWLLSSTTYDSSENTKLYATTSLVEIKNVQNYYYSLKLTIVGIGTYTFKDVQFVNITKCQISLIGDFDMEYNGTNGAYFTLLESNIPDDIYSELIGSKIYVEYTSAEVDSTVLNVISADIISSNYNFGLSGKINPIELVIDIGEQTIEYTGESVSYTHASAIFDNVILENTIITTNGSMVGEYSGTNLSITSTEAYFKSEKQVIELKNLMVTVTGTIKIVPKKITGLEFITEKTYNGESQTIDVILNENALSQGTDYILVDADTLVDFEGAKDAGIYNLKFTLNLTGYEEFVQEITFTINKLDVFIDVTDSNISKIYDGNTDISLNYNIYADDDRTEFVFDKTDLTSEIKSLIEFDFRDANASQNIGINVNNETNNYNFEVINEYLVGEIIKRKINIVVDYTKQYDEVSPITIPYQTLIIKNAENDNFVLSDSLISGNLVINGDYVQTGEYPLNLSAGFEAENLIVNENRSLLINYEVSSVTGEIDIKKATITIELTKTEYEYTGKVVELSYLTTRQDGKRVDEIVKFETSAINVGSHSVTFELADGYDANYDYSGNTLHFTIYEKAITITVNASKYYDGTALMVASSEFVSVLCADHTYKDSYVVTTSADVFDYNVGGAMVTKVVTIVDKDGNDVTSNYKITYSGVLEIAKKAIKEEDIKLNYYTYNGEERDFTIQIKGLAGSGEEYKTYKTSENGASNGDVVVSASYITGVSSSIGSFKYAGDYRITVSSNGNNFETFSLDITNLIAVKEITNISFNSKTKVYDGTTAFNNVISSSDIFNADKDYVYISGEFVDANVSTSSDISLTLQFQQLNMSSQEFEMLQKSYVLSEESKTQHGSITKREVTFTYSDDYYYQDTHLIVGVENFAKSNTLADELFTGIIEFNDVKNANEYNLSEETASLNGLSVTSSLDNYIIIFEGEIVIHKAVLEVKAVLNNIYTYNAENHTVTLVASIVDEKGVLADYNAELVLSSTYKYEGSEVTPINVGKYTVVPEVASRFTNNYTYEGGEIDEALTIVKRDIQITIAKDISNTGANVSVEIGNDYATNLVAGHVISGTATTIGSANGTYTYEDAQVNISNIKILQGELEVQDNYNIEYNIQIIIRTLLAGEYNISQNTTYTYSSQDQSSLVSFLVEVGELDGTVSEYTITKDSQGYPTVEGFYSDNSCNNEIAVIDAGIYYAKILIAEGKEETVAFNVYKYSLTQVYLDSELINKYFGIKVYDATSKQSLYADVFSGDSVEITAIYTDASGEEVVNVGNSYIASLELTGTSANNYELAINTYNNASIEKRTITISYIGETYEYAGALTKEINATELQAENLVNTHSLAGSISISILNAGKISLDNSNVKNLLVVNAGEEDCTENYTFVLKETSYIEITRAKVTVSWNKTNFTYNSEDRTEYVLNNLTYVGNYTSGVVSDVDLVFSYNKSEETTDSEVTAVKNAGIYQLFAAKSKSNNFEYTIDTDNNEFIINKKSVSVTLGTIEVKFDEYMVTGYDVEYDMIQGMYESDKSTLAGSKYLISISPIAANVMYSCEDNAIIFVWNSNFTQNYEIKSSSGGIYIYAPAITFEKLEELTYNSKNQFDQIEVVYSYESNPNEKFTITSDNTTYGEIEVIEIRNAGTYELTLTINTATYKVKLVVNQFLITSAEYEHNKEYDGTTTVYNMVGNTKISSTQFFAGDEVYLIGSYESALCGTHNISFELLGEDKDNYKLQIYASGTINLKTLIFDFGTVSKEFNVNNTYELAYSKSVSLVGNDTIDNNTIKLSLTTNKIGSYAIATTNIEKGIKIVDGEGKEVVNCYNLKYIGIINVGALKFSVVFSEFDENKVEYDATEKHVEITINGVSEDDAKIIANNIIIQYSNSAGDAIAVGSAPVKAGSYTAKVIYNGSANYILNGTTEYNFEITKYVYEVNNLNQISEFSKQFNTNDPALTQRFIVDDTQIVFDITYSRESGEAVGTYDLYVSKISNASVDFVCEKQYLTDKFEITTNEQQNLTVTIISYKLGNLQAYYGSKNNGEFDISNFEYTTNVANITNLTGKVIFNTGNVGAGYTIKGNSITCDQFANIALVSDLTLEIVARTLIVESNSFSKVYDGNNLFEDYTLNFNSNSIMEGEFDDTISVVTAMNFDNSSVGKNIDLKLSFVTNASDNFVVSYKNNANKVGEITPLDVVIELNDQSSVYGETINIAYVVTAINSELTNSQLAAEVTSSLKNATYSTSGHVNVGIYDIIISSNGNVNVDYISKTFTITMKELIVSTMYPIIKVADGTKTVILDEGNSYMLTGNMSGDDVSVDYAEYNNSSYGIDKPITIYLKGNDKANYIVNSLTGEIVKKEIKFIFNYYYSDSVASKDDIMPETMIVENIIYNYYGKANSMPTPTAIGGGYIFRGWSLSPANAADIINSNSSINSYITEYISEINVYAIWEVKGYTINIVLAKYDLTSKDYVYTTIDTLNKYFSNVIQIDDITIDASKTAHCEFMGYGVDNIKVLSKEPYVVTKDATLYFVYNLVNQTITIDSNGGYFENINSVEYSYSNSNSKFTIIAKYGQMIQDVISSTKLEKQLIVNKTGYAFEGWKYNGSIVTTSDILNITATSNIIIAAQWSAIEKTLTLDANGGKFTDLTQEQIGEGWTLSSDKTKAYISIAYSSAIPTLIEPVRDYYTFTEYKDSVSNIISSGKIWTKLENLTVYANYSDMEFELSISTGNATIKVTFYDSLNNVVSLTNSAVSGYVYKVKTSYKAVITALANEGYSFSKFEHDVGTTSSNVLTINGFTEDENVNVIAIANEYSITINLDSSLAKVTANDQTSTDGALTIKAYTGDEVSISVEVISEGYEVSEWIISNTKASLSGESTDTTRSLTGFVSNIEITITVVASEHTLSISNDYEKGFYVYDAISHKSDDGNSIKIKTNETKIIEVYANYGYEIEKCEFISYDGEISFTLDKVVESDKTIISIKGITCDGTIVISYKIKSYTVTFQFAIFDKETNEYYIDNISTEIISINSLTYKNKDTYTGMYNSQIDITPFDKGVNGEYLVKDGYVFYGFRSYVDSNFYILDSVVGMDNSINYTIEENIIICAVYTKEVFTVSYSVSNSIHGNLLPVGNTQTCLMFSESVYYGNSIKGAIVNYDSSSRKFLGWYVGETFVSSNTTLQGITIKGDIQYVAVLEGLEFEYVIKIESPSDYDITDDINNLITLNGHVLTSIVKVDGENVYIAKLSCKVGDNISINLNVNDYYTVDKLNGILQDKFDGTLILNNVKENDTGNPHCEILLKLKSYRFTVKANFEKAMTVYMQQSSCENITAFNIETLKTDDLFTYATFDVTYGGKVVIKLQTNTGYNFVNIVGLDIASLDNNLEFDIFKNEEILVNFTKVKYKVNFYYNYPNNEKYDVVTYYIDRDDSTFYNQDGSIADVNLLKQPIVPNTEIEYEFDGWGIDATSGAFNIKYYFDDQGKLYYLQGDEKVYGFVGPGESIDETGIYESNLYAVWYIETHKVDIVLVPDIYSFDEDLDQIFEYSYGKITTFDSELGKYIISYMKGANVIVNVPEIEGTRFAGWKLNQANELNTEPVEFNMGDSDTIIYLYYNYVIEVEKQEPVAGENSVDVNGYEYINCITGQNYTVTATAGLGFEFSHWLVNGELNENFEFTYSSTFTLVADGPIKYTAVFIGKTVLLNIEQSEHVKLSFDSASLVNEITAKFGDSVKIYILGNVDDGYILENISVNGSVQNIVKSSDGTYYTLYLAPPTDAEFNFMTIKSIVKAMDIVITFEINISDVVDIMVNGNLITETVNTFKFDDTLEIALNFNSRYSIVDITKNEEEFIKVTTFTITLNRETIGNGNKISFVIEMSKNYWIDVKETMAGMGTAESPYQITSAEQLAYLAYLINNNKINQNSSTIYYQVMNDIDLTSRFWIPIGTEENPFNGVFILRGYKITGTYFAEEYTHFSWDEYAYHVFGYVSDSAKIVLEKSNIATIILFVSIGVIIIIAAIIIIVILTKKKNKIKKLSTNLGANNLHESQNEQPNDEDVSNITIEEDSSLDVDIDAILEESKKAQQSKEENENLNRDNAKNDNDEEDNDDEPIDLSF